MKVLELKKNARLQGTNISRYKQRTFESMRTSEASLEVGIMYPFTRRMPQPCFPPKKLASCFFGGCLFRAQMTSREIFSCAKVPQKKGGTCPKTNSLHLKIGGATKGKACLPTIHFQVRAFSFREGSLTKVDEYQ